MGTTGSPYGAVLLVDSSSRRLMPYSDVSPTVIVRPGRASARARAIASYAMMTSDYPVCPLSSRLPVRPKSWRVRVEHQSRCGSI